MKKIRIGNDIVIKWRVTINGEEVNLEGLDLSLYISTTYQPRKAIAFTVAGNEITATYKGSEQRATGVYRLTLYRNEGESAQSILDACDAFELVRCSCLTVDSAFGATEVELPLADLGVGIPGLSAYEIAVAEGFKGTQAEWIASLSAASEAAAEECRNFTEAAKISEKDRQDKEALRVTAEDKRAAAETARQSAEANRATAESSRATAEQQRVTAETARKDAEASRVSAETARQSAEATRQSNEQSRQTAEQGRVTAEQQRADAEAARAEEFATFTATLAAKEDKANKVTSINADADDAHYPSAKAVKVALSELEGKISYNSEEQADFLTGILIWYETTSEHVGGETAPTAGYSSTDFIDTNSVVSVETNAVDFAGTVACIAFYDDSKDYLGGLKNQSNKRLVNAEDFPIGTKYIRFSTNTNAQPNHYAKIIKSIDIKSVLDGITEDVGQVKVDNEKYNNLHNEIVDIPFKLGCYISSGVNQGQHAGDLIINAGNGYAATEDYYLLDKAKNILFKCASWGKTIFNIAFYDENKVYIENSGSIYSSARERVIESKDFPVGAKYARFSHQVAVASSYYAKYDNTYSALEVLNGIVDSDASKGSWAVCGDSITHANHSGIDEIDVNDKFCPFDNVHGIPSGIASIYRRKNYAYYVAKEMKLKWANYGWGGTTLHNCTYNGIFLNGFSVDRYKQFADGVDFDYISIFFGYNDAVFGVYAQKEKWLSQTYGGTIYYPTKSEDIGKPTFATQEQKDAVDAVTGVVNGVNYDNNRDYFIAKMVGTIDDADNTTFMGAFNVVLPYLINKYPLSKILLIVPYAITYDNVHESGPNKMMRDSVIAIARKWNVAYYDFRESCPILEKSDAPMTGYADLRDFRERTLTADRLHPNNDGYKYIYQSILNKLKSL